MDCLFAARTLKVLLSSLSIRTPSVICSNLPAQRLLALPPTCVLSSWQMYLMAINLICGHLVNSFSYNFGFSKMALVIDDCLDVWEDMDHPLVHAIPAFNPYHTSKAERL